MSSPPVRYGTTGATMGHHTKTSTSDTEAVIWKLTLAYVSATGDDLRTCYARAVSELQAWVRDRDEGNPMGWRNAEGHVIVVRAKGHPVV